ncbi:uncharacterized protein LOC131006527 [Salvia miltiorrhiza]|uniref:uncharacterized protein LOC131006527 n=1 Tax=Salvia miltiorrhiza TaxID=226208 RepID=UPI0025AC6321|nr:uncharacterized protein LOC131006527 [Salvia miltiorrhiza]
MVDNNCSESFNSNIVDARHKPIVSMLEDIRLMCMKRITDRKSALLTWKGEWAPNVVRFFDQNKSDSIKCHVVWNGEYGYEVSEGEDRHNVFVDTKKCTCRVWELTGVPCCHTIVVFHFSSIDLMTVISQCYYKEVYAKAYEHVIHHVPGVKFWNVRAEDEVEPPLVEIKVGRPKKNRVRAKHEPRHQHKLGRKGKLQHCSLC